MAAVFSIPNASVSPYLPSRLRACQSAFERAIHVATAAMPAQSVTDTMGTPRSADSVFDPVPAAAVKIGRQCLSRLGTDPFGDGRSGADSALAPYDLAFLFRLAVGVNDDALVRKVVNRQLALANIDTRDRGHILEAAITLLLQNQWPGPAKTLIPHRTAAHDALAKQYAAVLDTMRPAGQVVLSRLHVMQKLGAAMAPAQWDVNDELARARAQFAVATSVPLSAVPEEDRAEVQGLGAPIAVAWLAYLQTPSHANLARWVAARDSMLHVPAGTTIDSLIDRPAPRLSGDYWFNVPSGSTSPLVPAPGRVTLLRFGDDLDSAQAAKLRQLSVTYPSLQIVLVAMTHGRTDTAEEARRISRRLTDALQRSALVCVLQTRYHADSLATQIPLASPVLDRFHLDPRDYDNISFLIDAEGWLISDAMNGWDERLVQRLVAHGAHGAHGAHTPTS